MIACHVERQSGGSAQRVTRSIEHIGAQLSSMKRALPLPFALVSIRSRPCLTQMPRGTHLSWLLNQWASTQSLYDSLWPIFDGIDTSRRRPRVGSSSSPHRAPHRPVDSRLLPLKRGTQQEASSFSNGQIDPMLGLLRLVTQTSLPKLALPTPPPMEDETLFVVAAEQMVTGESQRPHYNSYPWCDTLSRQL